MGISATPPPSPENVHEILLEFPDNRLLIDLCGEFDRNLAQIEHALDINIVRRGNRLAVVGGGHARLRASEVLQTLYSRLEAGRAVDAGVIDGEITMGDDQSGAQSDTQGETSGRAAQKPKMFEGGRLEIKTRKLTVEPRSAAQNAYVKALFENRLTFGIGPAGTGKTYLAVAVGVNLLIAGDVDRIILSRPAVEAGERLGFLPGDMRDKVDPYMQPLYDALDDFLPAKQMARLFEEKRLEIAPLAFMRGRTLANAFVVLDEAQNTTAMQMKMFLTRLGRNSRMVVTGDPTQVDLPRGATSGLAEAQRLLKSIDGISFSYLTAKDVVRHPLVARIIEAYDADKND